LTQRRVLMRSHPLTQLPPNRVRGRAVSRYAIELSEAQSSPTRRAKCRARVAVFRLGSPVLFSGLPSECRVSASRGGLRSRIWHAGSCRRRSSHRGLHVVVDVLRPQVPLNRIVGIEHDLLSLARIGADKHHPAGESRTCTTFTSPSHPSAGRLRGAHSN
jgi:hypothetical protein